MLSACGWALWPVLRKRPKDCLCIWNKMSRWLIDRLWEPLRRLAGPGRRRDSPGKKTKH